MTLECSFNLLEEVRQFCRNLYGRIATFQQSFKERKESSQVVQGHHAHSVSYKRIVRIVPFWTLCIHPNTRLRNKIGNFRQNSGQYFFNKVNAVLRNQLDAIHSVNFIEKILATVLAKVSNFIPEAGIWMNTQRPEWNDANNALVGNGVSMVTLYFLRRSLGFMDGLLADAGEEVKISAELATFFTSVKTTLESHQNLLTGSISDADRKRVLDGVGEPASAYRKRIYEKGFSRTFTSVSLADVRSFAQTATAFMEHSIDANKRKDGLYHA